MASPWLPHRGIGVILAIALALAGCGAPKSAQEPDSLVALPDPIHDERSIAVSFEAIGGPPIGPCGPTTNCVDYPFTLPRRALVVADLTWTNPQWGMALELLRGGERLEHAPGGGGAAARLVLEADAGDYVLRVQPSPTVNDRYVLDVEFREIALVPARATDARSTAEAHADIAASMADVPCEASSVDAVTTSENLVQLAQVEYLEGQHGELDARDGWLVVTTLPGGFELVDVSDPLSPVHHGTYHPEGTQSWDAKWMPDGRTVVVGHDATIDLIDVSTILDGHPAAEFFVLQTWDYEPAGPTDRSVPDGSMHMLTPARIGGTDWVFLSTQGSAGVAVLKLDNVTRTLSLAGRIGNDAFSGGVLGPHDASLIMDESTGAPILYVANGEQGWRAFDVSNPLDPQQLAHVLHPFGGAFAHSIVAQTVGQRRLVAVSEEGPSVLMVYDATDWARPVPIGMWFVRDRDYLGSTHNIQVVDGLLYLAHYRAGAFVFDLRDLGSVASMMEPILHFEPPEPQGPAPPTFGINYGHNIWEVIVHRGILYASDIDAGTYVLGFGCLTPGDEAASSRN